MSFTEYQSLADRVVVITGGASGIGETFVRAFAANSARVAFLDLQEEAGAALAASLRDSARHAPLFVACDLTDVAALRAALERSARASSGLPRSWSTMPPTTCARRSPRSRPISSTG